jgi:hypothetical protein
MQAKRAPTTARFLLTREPCSVMHSVLRTFTSGGRQLGYVPTDFNEQACMALLALITPDNTYYPRCGSKLWTTGIVRDVEVEQWHAG